MPKAMPEAHLKLLESATKVALSNACKALSNMFHDEVIVDKLTFGNDCPQWVNNATDKYASVFSKVIGDFTANTFLLFDEHAEGQVAEVLLPDAMRAKKQMRDAILMELDNILVAALVTKYANLFGTKIHGHVPSLEKTADAKLIDLISSKNEKIKTVVSFEAEVLAFKSQLTLRLMFFFDAQLLDVLSSFDRSKSHVADDGNKKGGGFFKKLFG